MLPRLVVSICLLFFVFGIGKADPLVPVGTVIGGTIVASASISQSITANLTLLDPNGNVFLAGAASQGSSIFLIGGPGTPVSFQAAIAGTADQGNIALNLIFKGTGPPIPDTSASEFDLIGHGEITFSGGVFLNHSDMFNVGNPLFTISGVFTGPISLHFIRGGDGLFILRTATFNVADNAVPEPVSVVLFGTGIVLTALSAKLRRRRN